MIVKHTSMGEPALTKRLCGFDSQLVLGPVIPKTLEMGVVPACMVLTMKQGPRNTPTLSHSLSGSAVGVHLPVSEMNSELLG